METSRSGSPPQKRLRTAGHSSVTPAWADLDKQDLSDSESDDELLKTARKFTSKSTFLAQGNIDTKRCRHLNFEEYEVGESMKCVEFHPKSQVALTGTTNGTITLYEIDGKKNPKLQSIKLKNFPLNTAHFTRDGEELLAGSNRYLHFYVYDLMSEKIVQIPSIGSTKLDNLGSFKLSPDGKYIVFYGHHGYASLFATRTKEWITNLRMNSEVTDIAFGYESKHLFSHTADGEVYVWDMASRKCMHKFEDHGCIRGTSIEYSPNGQYLACGSNSGVVNIYDTSSLLETRAPTPQKCLTNLRVHVDHVKFNSTSEVLAMTSSCKENGIKLVHLPSMNTFQNFPGLTANYARVNCIDFSANSGYMAFSCSKGVVYMYRMLHYAGF